MKTGLSWRVFETNPGKSMYTIAFFDGNTLETQFSFDIDKEALQAMAMEFYAPVKVLR